MKNAVVIYLAGIIFNISFITGYWWTNRRVIRVEKSGIVFFILLSWLVYPLHFIIKLLQS